MKQDSDKKQFYLERTKAIIEIALKIATLLKIIGVF